MKKILIKKTNEIIEIAYTEDGKLKDYKIIDENNKSLVGNIYVGIVDKIVKNTFAFIKIGEIESGFIDLTDYKESKLFDFIDNKKKLKIKHGDSVLVQVLKDGTEIKGPSLSTEIGIKGTSMILVNNVEKTIGISKKILVYGKRNFLKKLGSQFSNSVIFRTESEEMTEDELIKEYHLLRDENQKILNAGKFTKAPALIKNGENGFLSIIMNFAFKAEEIFVDNIVLFETLKKIEILKEKIKFEETPDIFSSHFIFKEVEKLFMRKIWLKSGGFIIIDYAEAATIIDINSGKSINGKDREKIVLKTNLEAIDEIGKQMKLRNLSGMILIDLIDMKFDENKQKIIDKMKKNREFDNIPVEVHGISNLGLLEVTRKKTSEPIYKINTNF